MTDFKADFKKIQAELDSCERPLFFFDDDPDGLSSFLLMYRYVGKGKGIIVKSTPKLTAEHARKAEEYGADKVFALDLPMMDQGFVDALKVPLVYIDHHTPLNLKKLYYFNPRCFDPELYYPVSLIAYNVVKQNIWIAAVGVVGDFKLPPFLKQFREQFPDYVGDQATPEELLFDTKLGELIQIISMVLKGPTSRVMQCVRVLTRIEHPDEIVNQTSSRGRFVYKYAQKHLKVYSELMKDAEEAYDADDQIMLFIYPGSKLSLTADLALELIHRHHDKIVIVGREKNGEIKMSIRSRGVNVRRPLDKALKGVQGYGGGHEQACGANIAQPDFKKFLNKFRQALP